MKKSGTKYGFGALVLVGSLLYLVTLVALWGSLSTWSLAANVWPTVIAAIGIIASITLLWTSVGVMMGHQMATGAAMRFSAIAGVVIVALTLTSATWLAVGIVGFILSMLGSTMAMM